MLIDLFKKRIGNHWEESGSIDLIKTLFNFKLIKDKIELLLNNEDTDDQDTKPVLVKLNDLKFSKEDFLTLRNLIERGKDYELNDDAVIDLFLRYILAAGYLTVKEGHYYSSEISVKLLNNEVKSELENKLISYYEKIYRIDRNYFENVTDELIKIMSHDDTNGLKKSLESLFEQFPKFLVTKYTEVEGVHGNEDFLHSIISYTALQIKNLSKFSTEVRYKREVRADIIFINEKARLATIIELKYNKTAEEALEQAKKYVRLFHEYHDIPFIKSFAINVSSDKKVAIQSRVDNNPSFKV